MGRPTNPFNTFAKGFFREAIKTENKIYKTQNHFEKMIVPPLAIPFTDDKMLKRTSAVYVISTFPDNINHNHYLRSNIADGIRETVPDTIVHELSSNAFLDGVKPASSDICLFVGSVLDLKFTIEAQLYRARKSGARTAVWLHDDPYEFDASWRVLGLADVIFTNDRAALYHYPDQSPVFHLPMASPSKPLLTSSTRPGCDFIFAGVPFPNRIRFFANLKNEIEEREARLSGMLIGPSWNMGMFPFAIDMRIPNSSLLDLYRESKSCIYLGRELDLLNKRYGIRPSTPGPRLFECAGVGGCQIAMTPGLEITEYFEPGTEFLLVDSAEEAVEHMIELNANHAKSVEIGKRAQKRVAAEHLYRHRASFILEMLTKV